MIIWNTRGLNKAAIHNEISSRLRFWNINIAGLLETRVKEQNAVKIRRKFGNWWSFIDNYPAHPNGRIWILWNPS